VSQEKYTDMIPGGEHIREHLLKCWMYARDFECNGGDLGSLFSQDVGTR
jgi:hypothetical protein